MRSVVEIQRAHDLLHGIVRGEAPNPMRPADSEVVRVALDCLCWVLEHEDNLAFAENLGNIEHELAMRGYVLDSR